MSESSLGSPPPDVLIEPRDLQPLRRRIADKDAEDALAQFEREQLARDIADIEVATAALRRGQPTLQTWTKPAAPTAAKPRPLWLLIGALWLSTALITAGAVAAIATFAG